LSDAELLTMAVLQVLIGFTSETRFLRYAQKHLGGYFPYLPHQSGYNKRLRKSQFQLNALIRVLGQGTTDSNGRSVTSSTRNPRPPASTPSAGRHQRRCLRGLRG
jgi:hypothetical protein